MTLQIRENAYYLRRDGKVVGPAIHKDPGCHIYPWYIEGCGWYMHDGAYTRCSKYVRDLISECNADGSPILDPHILFMEGERVAMLEDDLEEMINCNRTNLSTIDSLKKQRDTLEADLASSQATHDKLRKDADYLVAENTRLESELEKLRPKPVVTSVWRNVYEYGFNVGHDSRQAADGGAHQKRIAVLRLDTCNGVMTCELESV